MRDRSTVKEINHPKYLANAGLEIEISREPSDPDPGAETRKKDGEPAGRGKERSVRIRRLPGPDGLRSAIFEDWSRG
jgi:hypothetical protein